MVLLVAGCSGPSQNRTAAGPSDGGAFSTGDEGGLTVEKADLNGDGRTDVLSYYREVTGADGKKIKILVRKTVDINGDNKADVNQFFDDQGELLKQELDLDYDKRVDKIVYYKKGKIEREELSSLYDGRFDVKKFYDDGVLVLKQVDTRHNGHFDEFQYFVGNTLARVGWDRDGDGKPEQFEENPATK
jgi:hypothetical protein